jgi:MarR family transcriptional regulator, transcriptional regulator for hemolysin
LCNEEHGNHKPQQIEDSNERPTPLDVLPDRHGSFAHRFINADPAVRAIQNLRPMRPKSHARSDAPAEAAVAFRTSEAPARNRGSEHRHTAQDEADPRDSLSTNAGCDKGNQGTPHLQRALKSIRLTQSQCRVLVILSGVEPGGMIQTDLAHAMDLGKTTLGGLIDRLEVKRYVCRRPGLKDRRIKWITLTSKGRGLISEIREVVVEMNARVFRRFAVDVAQTEDFLSEVKYRLVEMGARCK